MQGVGGVPRRVWAEGQRTEGQGPTNVVQVLFPSFAHALFLPPNMSSLLGHALLKEKSNTFDSFQTTTHMVKNEGPEKAQILPKATQQDGRP